MKILLLTTHLNSGGITSYLETLSKELLHGGHDVFLGSSGGNKESDFVQMGVKNILLNIKTKSECHPKIYFATQKLVRLIKKEQIQVVHSQTRITQVMGRILKKTTGCSFVSTCHGFFKTRISRRIVPCWGDSVIAISPAVKDHLHQDFKVTNSQIVLIPNGIDVHSFFSIKEDQKISEKKNRKIVGSPILGIVARLSDVKGHSVLLDAMPKVVKQFPSSQLLIVGQGKLESSLKEQVSRLKLDDSVLFFPVVDQTKEFLSLLDVFIMPSLQEGLGLSVLEAQAAELPVVASRVGGLLDIIEDGVTGRLFESRNSDALAAAIIDVLGDSEYAKRLGQAAKKKVESEYSALRMGQETIKVYQSLIKKF